MSKQRSPLEIQVLKESAEARVRKGDAYADIARDLGVSQTTLGNWAGEGRWRKKHIAFERNEERAKAMLAQIAESKRRADEEAEKRAAKAKVLGDLALEAMQSASSKGLGARPEMAAAPAHQLSMAMAQALLQQGQLGEAERAARFAIRFAQAQKFVNDEDAGRWREDRERMMDWWRNNSERFFILHRHATDAADELRSRVKFDQMAREAGLCPTCTRPADFWPAEMHEVRDAIFDRMEDKMLAEDETKAKEQATDGIDQKRASSGPADGCGGGCGDGCGDETAADLPTPLTLDAAPV
jgi:transposase-like protein